MGLIAKQTQRSMRIIPPTPCNSVKLSSSVLECASSFDIVSQATIDWPKVAQMLYGVEINIWIYADM
jgi:hypothetical protein